ncbi:MAG: hypothetical protein OXH93_21425, partial [Caldilineaceae bacterium]|nr:hypothetical protein [Caldilineaceae bacterium]
MELNRISLLFRGKLGLPHECGLRTGSRIPQGTQANENEMHQSLGPATVLSICARGSRLIVRENEYYEKIVLGTATWSPSLSDLEVWARQVTPAAELCPF